jgi:hypothetical protein
LATGKDRQALEDRIDLNEQVAQHLLSFFRQARRHFNEMLKDSSTRLICSLLRATHSFLIYQGSA